MKYGIEQDPHSGRWYVTYDGRRLHGPYQMRHEAEAVVRAKLV